MWIRSQDKTKLYKAECIEYSMKLEQITNEMQDKKGKPVLVAGRPIKEVVKETTWHCIYINGIQFAKYSTEEKAMKVIDLIQKQIINNETIYAHTLSGSGVRDYNVFQMPKDDEVEDDE